MSWKLDARWLLEFVQLSDLTRRMVEGHSAGLRERDVSQVEAAIIKLQDRKMGLR
jgi:hypothetical protein